MPLPTDMTVPAVADALGCSAPTVRQLFDNGKLSARADWRGGRRYLRFAGSDVQAFLDTHGPYVKRGGSGDTEVEALRAEVKALRALVMGRSGATRDGATGDGSTGAAERVVALEEVVLLQRAAMAANQETEEARARATALLLDAVRELEAVDGHRRTAIKALDEAIGALTIPGSVRGVE